MTELPDPLPSPLIVPGRITSLIGPLDDELFALTAAVAVSYRSGYPMIPGFLPNGPSDAMILFYEGSQIEWRSLIGDIAEAAGIAVPHIRMGCLSEPIVQDVVVEHDPDFANYWAPLLKARVDTDTAAAEAVGRELPPLLTIIVGTEAAAGSGEGALQRLYHHFRGRTMLMVGLETVVPGLADYGPVIELPDFHNSTLWRDVLARVTGGYDPAEPRLAERDVVRRPTAGRVERDAPVAAGSPGILYGFAALFDVWREERSREDGHYLERFERGAFGEAITLIDSMKCSFRHGKDPRLRFKSLGKLSVLEENDRGLYYEVPLLDADYTRELVPRLIAGEYGSSVSIEVLEDRLVKAPGKSEHNRGGIPELTIVKALCWELGPCERPRYPGTSAGIRLAD